MVERRTPAGRLFGNSSDRILALRLILALAFPAWLSSCGGDSTSGPDPVDDTVASVSVTPSSASLNFVGATTQLTASAKNSGGSTLGGTTFTWATSDASVVTVSGMGLVTAFGNGTATITATASGATVSGAAQVTVQQSAAAVAVTPQDGSVVIGETLQLAATATDGGGAAMPSATFIWSSSDPSMATVSTSGLVTGVSDGPVTITATSGTANGAAPVRVVRPDLEITQDTDLSGDVAVNDFTIQAGVTVTATADLTIDATGLVEIAGALTGDCVAMTILGDTAVTVKGRVDNGCTAGGDGADLTIGADGELTLEDATIISSGEMDFSNDPTLTDDDFPVSGPSAARDGGRIGGHPNGGGAGPARAGRGIPFTVVNRTTVQFQPGATGPNPADPGKDNSNGDGGDGDDGRRVSFRLRGNAEFRGGTLLWGQDGGKGGSGAEQKTSDVEVRGGKGGEGGRIRIFVTGALVYKGANNVVRSGSGGNGGDATGTGLPNADPAKAPSAKATGGGGADPGLLDLRAGGGISVESGGALKLEMGNTGDGGNATATGADGADATADKPAQEGGDADATGGDGGIFPDKQLAKRGNVTGADPVIQGVGGSPMKGGKGGDATSTAGKGGDGLKPNKDGAAGGAIKAKGGEGGDYLLKDLDGALLGDGGDGGMATFKEGNGGMGWDDCQDLENPEAGGAGGTGGSAGGGDGDGGEGKAKGSPGDTKYENAGNGGDGKRENGALGAGGSPAGVITKGANTTVGDNFTDGEPGGTCPPAAPPVKTYIDQGSTPNSSGLVAPGSYQLDLLNGAAEAVGTIIAETFGAPGNHFVGLFPSRWGYFGLNGWDILFSSATLGGKTAEVMSCELCYWFSSIDGANPAVIQQLNDLGEVIWEQLVTSLASPPASAGAQKTGEGGTNCRYFQRVPGSVRARIFGPGGRYTDVGGVEGRPGIILYLHGGGILGE